MQDVWQGQQASHQTFGQYEASRAQNEAAIARDMSGGPAKPFVRTEQKVGRNDPCWCGSGKKYKKCHYAEDQQKAAAATLRGDDGGQVQDQP